MTAVCLQAPATLDAIYPRVAALTSGSRMVGVVYDTAPSGANETFCSSVMAKDPRRLVANGSITTLEGTDPAWLRLPMPQTLLEAGVYWIGAMFESTVTCYSDMAAGSPPIGPGSKDAYTFRPFASGPGEGPGMSWTRGSGAFAVYATTRP